MTPWTQVHILMSYSSFVLALKEKKQKAAEAKQEEKAAEEKEPSEGRTEGRETRLDEC